MSTSVLPILQTQLVRYGMSITLILGIIGNFFIVILFSRRRQNSCAMYLSGSAVLNTLGLIILIPSSIYSIDHQDPTNYSLVFCKTRWYFSNAWGQLARYLMVIACIDRFVLTTNNARFQVMNRPKVARWIMFTLIVFYHIFIIHLAILTTINNGRCGQFGVYYILYQVHVLIFLCMIPPVSMTIFGYLAYHKMRQLHARIRPSDNIPAGSGRNISIHRRDRDLFTMVLVEVVLYVVTMSTYPFILLEIAVTTYLGVSKSIQYIQMESFLATIAIFLIYVNSAIAFYLYLAVSKPFRKDFKELFTQLRSRVTGRDHVTVTMNA